MHPAPLPSPGKSCTERKFPTIFRFLRQDAGLRAVDARAGAKGVDRLASERGWLRWGGGVRTTERGWLASEVDVRGRPGGWLRSGVDVRTRGTGWLRAEVGVRGRRVDILRWPVDVPGSGVEFRRMEAGSPRWSLPARGPRHECRGKRGRFAKPAFARATSPNTSASEEGARRRRASSACFSCPGIHAGALRGWRPSQRTTYSITGSPALATSSRFAIFSCPS